MLLIFQQLQQESFQEELHLLEAGKLIKTTMSGGAGDQHHEPTDNLVETGQPNTAPLHFPQSIALLTLIHSVVEFKGEKGK